jgi:hypothetical protein
LIYLDTNLVVWLYAGLTAKLGLAEKVHKTNLDATGREKW